MVNRSRWRRSGWVRIVLAAVLLIGSHPSARAQAELILHTFLAGSTEPLDAQAPLTLGQDGNFYGAATRGGAYGYGCVYQVTPAGVVTVMHSFDNISGGSPYGHVALAADGSIWGAATGGPIGAGVIYRVTPSQTFQIVHSFTSGDGQTPNGLMLAADGNFYGTTQRGGAFGLGALYQLTPNGAFRLLWSFGGVTADGNTPVGRLVQGPDGTLYGVTSYGTANGAGAIFTVSSSFVEHVLYSFTADTGYPAAGVTIGGDGSLYGALISPGIIYKVTLPQALFSTVATLSSSEQQVQGALTASGNLLYACAFSDGFLPGEVFSCSTSGTLHKVHAFTGSDGYAPLAPVTVGPSGALYGVTSGGGAEASGTVWTISSASVYSVIHNFQNANTGGSNPAAAPTLGNDGKLYLPMGMYGAANCGAIDQVDHSGFSTAFTTFNNPGNNAPQFPLFKAADGSFYGVTQAAVFTPAVLYHLSATGVSTTVFSYDTVAPAGSGVTLAADGNLYGVSGNQVYGAPPGQGGPNVLYQVTPAGVYKVLYTFGLTAADGANTQGSPVQAADGKLYGETEAGGANGCGAIYRMDLSGNETVVFSFNGLDGEEPVGGLTLASNGDLYGVTVLGGANGGGTVFEITPGAAPTVREVYAFDRITAGAPTGPPMLASDGNLYGATQGGGKAGAGAMYRLTLSGAFTLLHSSRPLVDGTGITSPPAEIGGDLYYVDATGGPASTINADGTLLRLNLNLHDHDINGDAHPDILFQNSTTGDIVYWTMNGVTKTGSGTITTSLNPDWQLVCSYDLNLDGHPDLILHNKTTGALVYWLMNGASVIGSGVLSKGSSAAWQPITIADMDGTGNPYLLWQNSTTGAVVYWHLDGTVVTNTGTLFPSIPPTLKLVAAADINGDGYPDLIFQNSTTGDVTCLYMQNLSVLASGYLATGLLPSWQLVGAVDLNGDFSPDLLWHSTTSGDMVYWLMHGPATVQTGVIANLALSWAPVER
ncbi:MAG: VCBS repeat-containing protein [Armatimonadetes bacterium]|nr:VCBS repeat-containing protein [Armatimonadota bacterium]MDE2205177.1 VCBS repeat-containing protein [Armatimonadota bacterium]